MERSITTDSINSVTTAHSDDEQQSTVSSPDDGDYSIASSLTSHVGVIGATTSDVSSPATPIIGGVVHSHSDETIAKRSTSAAADGMDTIQLPLKSSSLSEKKSAISPYFKRKKSKEKESPKKMLDKKDSNSSSGSATTTKKRERKISASSLASSFSSSSKNKDKKTSSASNLSSSSYSKKHQEKQERKLKSRSVGGDTIPSSDEPVLVSIKETGDGRMIFEESEEENSLSLSSRLQASSFAVAGEDPVSFAATYTVPAVSGGTSSTSADLVSPNDNTDSGDRTGKTYI